MTRNDSTSDERDETDDETSLVEENKDRLDRLEALVDKQRHLIESQREQLADIASTAGNEDVTSPVTRRGALTAGGLIALLGFGSGIAGAQPQEAGQGNPGGRIYNWEQDIDAQGNNLRNLGGINTERMDDEAFVNRFDGSNLEILDGSLNVTDNLSIEEIETTRLTDGVTDTGLNIGSESDLVLSVSGGQGTLRIETEGGHEIVLDDEDGFSSLSVRDNAGNSIEMAEGEVSVSADSKITLDAPTIELSADVDLDIESEGGASISSSAVTDIDGSIINLNGGAFPAARVGDAVSDGVIQTGSPTVFIG